MMLVTCIMETDLDSLWDNHHLPRKANKVGVDPQLSPGQKQNHRSMFPKKILHSCEHVSDAFLCLQS